MAEVKPQEVLLHIDHARVQFGSLVAVRDLSLEVRAGDLIGLIGPNGAGKTTLLRAAAGIQPLTCGQVLVLGERVLPGNLEAARQIGFTPDNPPVYEELTVRDFLRFVGLGYQLSGDLDERIDFWLDQVWLTEKAGQKIKALSRGMRQRIGLARTMLPNPNVILLDEPAAGLDPAGRVQFRQLLLSLREQGKAIIVSSHILADMNEYCTHIGIMAQGALLQYGTVAQISAGGDGERRRYEVVLTRSVPELQDLLARLPGVSRVEVERDQVTLEFSSCREEAARLLRHLVTEGIPVAAFSSKSPGLEEAYLRTGIRQVD
jgi:ABC-2 type transport system ATP-binding protein